MKGRKGKKAKPVGEVKFATLACGPKRMWQAGNAHVERRLKSRYAEWQFCKEAVSPSGTLTKWQSGQVANYELSPLTRKHTPSYPGNPGIGKPPITYMAKVQTYAGCAFTYLSIYICTKRTGGQFLLADSLTDPCRNDAGTHIIRG